MDKLCRVRCEWWEAVKNECELAKEDYEKCEATVMQKEIDKLKERVKIQNEYIEENDMKKIDRRMPLFKKELRRSVINGTKTQTRRIVKDQSFINWSCKAKCPYGKPGEIQVLREPLQLEKTRLNTQHVVYSDDHEKVRNNIGYPYDWKWKNDKLPAIFMPTKMGRYFFEITGIWVGRTQSISFEDCLAEGVKWQDVGGGEKMYYDYIGEQYSCVDPIDSFQTLWDSINTEDGETWNDNPWVWVVEFERKKR